MTDSPDPNPDPGLRAAVRDYASPATPPPGAAQQVLAALDRRRRRRTTVGAAAATLVLVGGVGLAVGMDRGDTDRAVAPGTSTTTPPATTPTSPAAPVAVDVPPDGFRYVAMGRVAVAVPESWPRNALGCDGVPERSTVEVDTRFRAVCLRLPDPFPRDSDVVSVQPLTDEDTSDWTPVVVDGLDALRSPVATELSDPGTTRASIAFPTEGVVFTAFSSTDRAPVTDLLDRVVVLDEHLGVPGFSDLQPVGDDGLGDTARAGQAYVDRLKDTGLAVVAVQQPYDADTPAGRILSVSPEPGTVVTPGSTVTMTVST